MLCRLGSRFEEQDPTAKRNKEQEHDAIIKEIVTMVRVQSSNAAQQAATPTQLDRGKGENESGRALDRYRYVQVRVRASELDERGERAI
jgi:hypothetical protein